MDQIVINQKMLVTFQVALYYVRPDSYHVFMSCDIVELGLETCRDLLRQLCFVKSLQSWNRINILVLRIPDIRIGVIIGLIRTSIVEFARDSFEVGNIWRKVHPELKLKELWMEK